MNGLNLSEVSVARLRARRRRLGRAVGDPQATLRGALQRQGRRCGRASCRCAQGELHGPYWYLAVHADGGRRSVYVPAPLAGAVEELVEATVRREAALAEISQINVELLRRRALG
ncbi:MAG: hypothetical protein LC790_18865 [Actinobacteria bacterium]|nr:hypothetical protein [Actinomycetota bacterium]